MKLTALEVAKKNRKKFVELLQKSRDVTAKTSYEKAAKLLGSSPAWEAMDDATRRQCFDIFVDQLKIQAGKEDGNEEDEEAKKKEKKKEGKTTKKRKQDEEEEEPPKKTKKKKEEPSKDEEETAKKKARKKWKKWVELTSS